MCSIVNEEDFELNALRNAALKSMRAKSRDKHKIGKRFNEKSATNGAKYSNLIVLTCNDDTFERQRANKSQTTGYSSGRTQSPNTSKRVLPGRFSRLERDEQDTDDTDDDEDDDHYSDGDHSDDCGNVALKCAFNDNNNDQNDSDLESQTTDTRMTSILPKSNASMSDSNVCNDDSNCMINDNIVDNNDVNKCSTNCHDINLKNDKIKLKINNNSKHTESMNLLEMRKLKFGDISADNQCFDRCNQSVVKYLSNDCSVKLNQNELNSNRNNKDFAYSNRKLNHNNNNRKTSNRSHNTHNNRVNNSSNNMTLRAHKTFGRNSDSHSRDCDDNNDNTGSTKKKLRSLVVIK